MKDEQKYYLCAFLHRGCDGVRIDSLLIDYHPLEHVATHNVILMNHIEVTKEQYDKYHGVLREVSE